jgi:hypothetical protein
VNVTPPPERAAHTAKVLAGREKLRQKYLAKKRRKVKPMQDSTPAAATAEDIIRAGDKVCLEFKKQVVFSPTAWGILSAEFKKLRDEKDARDIVNHIDATLKKPAWCLTLATSLGYKVKKPL